MTTEWRIIQKPDFFKSLLALSPKKAHQVLEKVNLLAQDPTPDAKIKKQLKYMSVSSVLEYASRSETREGNVL